ncbi:HEAT repeat domain-containing protein [Candidatus Poribacteria bacterium]|nr:HEAT repeat domain-containing protein [Candidatus Poribacteria bacterium]
MKFYHGTTLQNAIRIAEMGFLPRKGVVWFTTSKHRAQRRAKQKARKTASPPFVFTCEINVQELYNRLGKHLVMRSKGFLAIRRRVPPTRWVSQILQGESYENISPNHPGINRLSRWVENRMKAGTDSAIRPKELSQKLQQWLPNFFRGIKIAPQDLRFDYFPELADFETEPLSEPVDSREENALDALADMKPKRRLRGLELLAQLEHEDLYEWCTLLLSDESVEVRIAALQTIVHCDDGDPEVLLPLAKSQNKRIRAAAIAALAKHSAEDAPHWFERGLKDREPCVRLETASLLQTLDAIEHRKIFELALYDPNPAIKRLAEKLTSGKGYADTR